MVGPAAAALAAPIEDPIRAKSDAAPATSSGDTVTSDILTPRFERSGPHDRAILRQYPQLRYIARNLKGARQPPSAVSSQCWTATCGYPEIYYRGRLNSANREKS
ncbi:hypothetical protein DSM43518_04155 [Mycobacterium marinum]|nr:hypothetical protein MM1218R_02666 [Mycobacterium marinum]AXN49963.1 hypothetical protein CCUG20998_02558 [Mycobacterium marinum]RFZ04793.1 hypothetical protein DSM43518_04155 [Mycobacterium marinum]RFZ21463.1 hypothetical protein DSM43519_03394 [Mycobacterium marinum]RFZ27448.1 hypothetical protein NCTC2275_04652 [Mycobacterium marinum]